MKLTYNSVAFLSILFMVLVVFGLLNMTNITYVGPFVTTPVSIFIPLVLFIFNLIVELYGYYEYRKFILEYSIFTILVVIWVFINYMNGVYDLYGLVFAITTATIISNKLKYYWLKLLKPLLNGNNSYFNLNNSGIENFQIVVFTSVFNFIIFFHYPLAQNILQIIIGSSLINVVLCMILSFICNFVVTIFKFITESQTTTSSNECFFKLIKNEIILLNNQY